MMREATTVPTPPQPETRRLLLSLAGAGVMVWGCSWPSPERQFLLDYFHACRVYDLTVVERLAVVPCNPRTDGVVSRFELVGVERVSPVERRVAIQAAIRMFDGSSTVEPMTVTLSQREGRWMVTAITPPRASQTLPAASSDQPR
jgi:hypothetical protein